MDVAPDPLARFAEFGPIKAVKLTRTQKVVAARLGESWSTIPHVTHHDEADVTELELHRAAQPAERRLTALGYVIKAVALALRAFPQFNASLSPDGATLALKDYVHLGIAVDAGNGLLVPVLRDCDVRSICELAAELRDVSVTAREKGLSYDRMVGGCFTISSLGGIGGTGFNPIINAPEVAILGVSRTSVRPIWDGSTFQPRHMMPLSLSYDHRVINGADAARFSRHLADRLAEPQALET